LPVLDRSVHGSVAFDVGRAPLAARISSRRPLLTGRRPNHLPQLQAIGAPYGQHRNEASGMAWGIVVAATLSGAMLMMSVCHLGTQLS
jgi:hypothetical protein